MNEGSRVVVVTGGSRGIGFMIASGLVANGVRTYITARKAEACDAAAAELSAHGECVSIPADLSTADGLASFVTAITEMCPWGRSVKKSIFVSTWRHPTRSPSNSATISALSGGG